MNDLSAIIAPPGAIPADLETMVLRAVCAAHDSLTGTGGFAVSISSAQSPRSEALDPGAQSFPASRACRKKQLEWASGRAAAHAALKQLGFRTPPLIGRGFEGEPLWPDGITGSITHCWPWSIAVVDALSSRCTIGIDLEMIDRVRRTDVSKLVCRDTELQWIGEGAEKYERLTMLFSAKESLYKALYPRCRRYIDFQDAELRWEPEHNRFQGQILFPFHADVSADDRFTVHCSCDDGRVFSCVVKCWNLGSQTEVVGEPLEFHARR